LLTALVLAAAFAPIASADGKVSYAGSTRRFLFEPGSEHSLTDLFTDFKDVMPGDSITQTVTVRNIAITKIKADIYIRARGAWEESEDFLSKLNLKVKKSKDNEMGYMFDAAASEKDGLKDWVHLGTIFCGGEVNLDVTLTVPTDLSNEYQNKIGYLDWEFMVHELPVSPDDPIPPQTGDNSRMAWLIAVMAVSVIAIVVLIILRNKNRDEE
jgi:hypothetical protein